MPSTVESSLGRRNFLSMWSDGRFRFFLLLLLGALLLAAVLFMTFVGFASRDHGKTIVKNGLDFFGLLSLLDAGRCFEPVVAPSRRVISVSPHHLKLVKDVENTLMRQPEDCFIRMFASCDPTLPLQVCLLEKTCPYVGKHRLDRSHGNSVTPSQALKERSSQDSSQKTTRFDLTSVVERTKRKRFVDNRHFESDSDFCDALFNYVLLTTSPSVTSRLAEEYLMSGDEPDEIVHLLLFFLSTPTFRSVVDRLNCSNADYRCLLNTMCEYEIFPQSEMVRQDLVLFLRFMEHFLVPCLGEGCRSHDWLVSESRGWFSSCWLISGGFFQIIPTIPVDVAVAVFNRPCDDDRWELDLPRCFVVVAIYAFIFALLFLFIALLIYGFVVRARSRPDTTEARSRTLSRRLATSLPSLLSSRRATPRASQRSFASSWRFGRGVTDDVSFFGSLAGLSGQSTDSGLGFNTRLSTPRSTLPNLSQFAVRMTRPTRGSVANDYVLSLVSTPAVLPTPITHNPPRRTQSQRIAPILNFYEEEMVIGAGGEILEEIQVEGDSGVVDGLEEEFSVSDVENV